MIWALGIGIPLLYIGFGSSIARYVASTFKVSRHGLPEDRTLVALLVGFFWPVAFPFYLAIRGMNDRGDQ